MIHPLPSGLWENRKECWILGEGWPMDPFLKEMCLQVLRGDVDNESFARLLIETGINIESFEWDLIAKLLTRGDLMRWRSVVGGETSH